MIKLLHLYRFNGLTDSTGFDYTGLWETFSVKKLDTTRPEWKLRRVASFTSASVGDEIEFPQFLIESYANKVDRAALVGVPIKQITTG